jgi:hypothetical protein
VSVVLTVVAPVDVVQHTSVSASHIGDYGFQCN